MTPCLIPFMAGLPSHGQSLPKCHGRIDDTPLLGDVVVDEVVDGVGVMVGVVVGVVDGVAVTGVVVGGVAVVVVAVVGGGGGSDMIQRCWAGVYGVGAVSWPSATTESRSWLLDNVVSEPGGDNDWSAHSWKELRGYSYLPTLGWHREHSHIIARSGGS